APLRECLDIGIVKLPLLEDQNALLNIVRIIVHRIRMLQDNSATSTDSNVSFRLDPDDPIPIPEARLHHQPSNISHNRILDTVHQLELTGKRGLYIPAGTGTSVNMP